MPLLWYPVTLMLLAATVIATPPPGYVKQPTDDKNSANYEYKYEIGDINGKEGQGKVETRLGELASGRYYVNDEKSSTDVKYFADEWGYHPLVKYSASGDHSTSTTHLAIGDHVVKSLLNGTDVGEEVRLSRQQRPNRIYRQQLHRRRRPIKLIQPYTSTIVQDASITDSIEETSAKSQSTNDLSSVISDDSSSSSSSTVSAINSLLNYDLQRTTSRVFDYHEIPSSSSFHSNFNNYVTPSRASQEPIRTGDTSSNDDRDSVKKIINRYYNRPNNYVTKPSIPINDFTSTVTDDHLIIEHSGTFGRRLNPNYSKFHDNHVESDTTKKSIEIGKESTYDVSTLRTPTNIYSHPDESSYSSYFTPTPFSHFTKSQKNLQIYSTTSSPYYTDYRNIATPEIQSNNREKSISNVEPVKTYSDVLTNIFVTDRSRQNRENVDSSIATDSQSSNHDDRDKNATTKTTQNETTNSDISYYEKHRDHEFYVTLRQSLESEINALPIIQSSTPQSSSTYNFKPIIVAELSNHDDEKNFEYSTTFPCKDDEGTTTTPKSTSSSTPATSDETVLVTPNLRTSSSDITTSSVILNPIQAGVSLVNADETELITTKESTERSPAPVREDNTDVTSAVLTKNFSFVRDNELENLQTNSRTDSYEKINPSFGQTDGQATESTDREKSMINVGSSGKTVDGDVTVNENLRDQQIEIQKSVEVYQNAPVREIHYSGQVITQVSDINHQRPQHQLQLQQNVDGVVLQQQQDDRGSYQRLPDIVNVKQFNHNEDPPGIARSEQHQSLNSQISLETSTRASPTSATTYLVDLLRHESESTDRTTQRNTTNQVLSPGLENHSEIIKLIRNNIPEVKYTPAKTPRINVQVYPTIPTQSDNSNVRQQLNGEIRDNDERNEKARLQLQKILSETASLQRFYGGNDWENIQQQQDQLYHERQRQTEAARLELLPSKPVRENISENTSMDDNHSPHQQQQKQSTIVPYENYNLLMENNVQQNLGNFVEETVNSGQMSSQIYPASMVAERIIEKPIRVQQPYAIELPKVMEKKIPYTVEKIVEKPMPYAIEKIVEKKIPVPQPYAVHVQVPIDRVIEKQVEILQPYPVHVEKIIEKKVPYPVHRLVPQPYPVHIIQPYPIEKIIEKPIHIPITIEKIVEKKIHVPHPYPVQVPVKVPYPVEVTKYVERTVNVPYGVRYGVSYQQIMKPESSQGLYGSRESTSVPLYGLSLVNNQQRDNNRVNGSQQLFQGYSYEKPAIAFVTGRIESTNNGPRANNGWEQYSNVRTLIGDYQHDHQHQHQHVNNHQQGFAKKSYSSHSSKVLSLPHLLQGHGGLNRRQLSYRLSNSISGEKIGMKNEYLGPVPIVQQQQQQQQHKPQQQVEVSQTNSHQKSRSRSSSDKQQQSPLQSLVQQQQQQYSTAVTRAPSVSASIASSRRARQQQQQHENSAHYQTGPGAFRQSKMEYGFKPPMIPSVQYDEKTATKVEK